MIIMEGLGHLTCVLRFCSRSACHGLPLISEQLQLIFHDIVVVFMEHYQFLRETSFTWKPQVQEAPSRSSITLALTQCIALQCLLRFPHGGL